MIKKAVIRNFQSHEKTVFVFTPGVNIITGATDSGKSSALRAIRLAITNRPSGNSFHSNWEGAGPLSVKLINENGTITRSKGKVEEYKLEQEGLENPLIFHAFKTSIPEEIANAFNMEEVNLQNQLDPPFLLSKSAGDVATYFNKVAKLEKIDQATTNVNKWIRGLESTIEATRTELTVKKEKLKSFEYLQKFEIEIEVLEEDQNKSINVKRKLTTLKSLIDEIENLEYKITKKEKILPVGDLVDAILEEKKQRQELKGNIESLSDLIDSIKADTTNITQAEKVIKAEPIINAVLAEINTKKTIIAQISTLNSLITQISNTNGRLTKYKAEFELKTQKFKKEMGDTCLLCGQSIKGGIHTHDEEN